MFGKLTAIVSTIKVVIESDKEVWLSEVRYLIQKPNLGNK